jgi:drug/metabolite transporter (DMT)-like permease
MASGAYVLAIAVGALITGSLNTLTNELACKQSAEGTVGPATIWGKVNNENGLNHAFDHPYVLCLFMFVGEFICFGGHLVSRRWQSRDVRLIGLSQAQKGSFWFALPAMCDIIGTGTMYAGLCLSSASVFQMLRGSVVIFTCLLSVIWLKRKIYGYQWFSVLLVAIGITIVGWASVLQMQEEASRKGGTSDDHKDASGVMLGNMLIVLAQIVTALQMCIEEKLCTKFNTPALKVVGLEGLFGFSILAVLLIPMYFIKIQDVPLENTPDAFKQIGNNWVILVAVCCNALSITFFNACGVSITKVLSCSHRMVLDSVRNLVVWTASMIIGWDHFSWQQLTGFVILSLGTLMYNNIVQMPALFHYPTAEEETRQSGSNCGVSEHPSFLGGVEDDAKRPGREPMVGTMVGGA